jgi:hypothetical protein
MDTLNQLIAVHMATIADIDAGKKFTREGKDVTREIRSRCKREIAQCEKVRVVIEYMGAGNGQRAAELLAEIQEYLPRKN